MKTTTAYTVNSFEVNHPKFRKKVSTFPRNINECKKIYKFQFYLSESNQC